MLSRNLIENLFKKLRDLNEKGEIGLVGGAVMCLVYNARAATKDVNAIFEPSVIIRKLSVEIDTAAKAFIREP